MRARDDDDTRRRIDVRYTDALPRPPVTVLHTLRLAARAERLDALHSLRSTGLFYVAIQPEAPVSFVQEVARPSRLRFEVAEARWVPTIQATDGREAWLLEPGAGNPERLPSEHAERVARKAAIHGPLLHAAEQGHSVSFIGRALLDDIEVLELNIDYGNGEAARVRLDATNLLIVQVEETWRIGEVAARVETRFQDYRPVSGVLIPFQVEERNSQGWWRLERREAVANVDLSEQRFRFPGDENAFVEAVARTATGR